MNKIKKTMDSCFLDAQGTESKFLDIISFNITFGECKSLNPSKNNENDKMVEMIKMGNEENEDYEEYDYWRII